MTAKEYLEQAKRLDSTIECRMRELEYWRGLSGNLSSCNFGQTRSSNRPTEAPFVKCIEKIDEIECDISGKINELVRLREEMGKAIDSVENRDEQLVLHYRYLDDLTWTSIANKLFVSERTVRRIHELALENFVVPAES